MELAKPTSLQLALLPRRRCRCRRRRRRRRRRRCCRRRCRCRRRRRFIAASWLVDVNCLCIDALKNSVTLEFAW